MAFPKSGGGWFQRGSAGCSMAQVASAPATHWLVSSVRSPLAVREKLAVHGDHHAVALRVVAALHVHLEVNSAHDPVAKLLLDQRLERGPVDLHDLVEAVDQRVGGHVQVKRALARVALECG